MSVVGSRISAASAASACVTSLSTPYNLFTGAPSHCRFSRKVTNRPKRRANRKSRDAVFAGFISEGTPHPPTTRSEPRRVSFADGLLVPKAISSVCRRCSLVLLSSANSAALHCSSSFDNSLKHYGWKEPRFPPCRWWPPGRLSRRIRTSGPMLVCWL